MTAVRSCLLIGNSRWHWAIEEISNWNFLHTKPEPQKLLSLTVPLTAWAAVGPIPSANILHSSRRLQIEDVPLLDVPKGLGIDRALGAWGALKKAKEMGMDADGLLVADAGTVLSLTRIKANGTFAGGQLVPGLQLQLDAMAKGTENLTNPGFKPSNPPTFPFTTADAMRRGSLQALIGTLIEAQRKAMMPLWICGGDAPILVKELKESSIDVIHHPNLVLEGMVNIQQQLN